MGSRSTGGFCLAAALYLSTTRFLRNRAAQGVKLRVGAIAAIAAALLIGGIGMVWAYSYAAKAGMLGEEARDKYELESGGKYGSSSVAALRYSPRSRRSMRRRFWVTALGRGIQCMCFWKSARWR